MQTVGCWMFAAPFVELSAGARHACAISARRGEYGQVKCWGGHEFDFGQTYPSPDGAHAKLSTKCTHGDPITV